MYHDKIQKNLSERSKKDPGKTQNDLSESTDFGQI